MEKTERPTPDACLIASLKSLLRFVGGTWVEGWIEEAERAAKQGKVVKYE